MTFDLIEDRQERKQTRGKNRIIGEPSQLYMISGLVQYIMWPKKGTVSDSGFAIVSFLPDDEPVRDKDGTSIKNRHGDNLQWHEVIQPNSWGNIVCSGGLGYLKEGQSVIMVGRVVMQSRYGQGFQVAWYETILGYTPDEIKRVLSSGIIRGCRKARAEKIVNEFGEKTYEVLDSESAVKQISSINGIGKKIASTIVKSWNSHRAIANLLKFLGQHGVTANLCLRIYKHFGAIAYERIKENPYAMTLVSGIGFSKADSIALSMGMKRDAPERLEAGISQALSDAQSEGHCYLSREALIDASVNLFKQADKGQGTINGTKPVYVSGEMVAGQIEAMLPDMLYDQCRIGERIVSELIEDGKEAIYPVWMRHCEMAVSDKLKALMSTEGKAESKFKKMSISRWLETIKDVETKFGFLFAEGQKKAIVQALSNKVSVLTGGPGTGKSTITKAILDVFKAIHPELVIKLAAPSGKAAKRLSEATGRDAMTIHRMLECKGPGLFGINSGNSLQANLVVIDEVSQQTQSN